MLSEIDMEDIGTGTEEHVVVVGSCNNDATHITKGKRTKRRLRPLSPRDVAATVTSSCSSASGGGGGGDYGSFSSTSTVEGTDQEEEDMANCLILLAQGGGGGDPHPHHHHQQKQEAENHVEGGVGINKITERAPKSGFYIYECKTCNRTFPSFQALGGHRASHKKPKLTTTTTTTTTTQEEKKSPPQTPAPPHTTTCDEFEEAKQNHSHIKITNNPSLPVSLELGCGGVNKGTNNFNKCSTTKSSKIHECSICGSEFTSGQALGGHMRRHRASSTNNNNTPPSIQTTIFDAVLDVNNNKSRNVLELDLNLPAPEDDLRDSKFPFPTTQKSSMVLSPAPALVGCHY